MSKRDLHICKNCEFCIFHADQGTYQCDFHSSMRERSGKEYACSYFKNKHKLNSKIGDGENLK